MSWVKQLLNAYYPQIPPQPAALGAAFIALPMPKVKERAVKEKDKPADAYILNEDTNTWGFQSNKSTEYHEGSVSHLTTYDVQALQERELWGGNNRKGKAANEKTAHAKSLWHSGCSLVEISAGTGMGESWVEKRIAAFNAALSSELSEL